MKKILIVVLALVCFLGLSVSQAETTEQNINTSVTATASKMNLGESVTLTANTPKHGSSFKDSWSEEVEFETFLEEENNNYRSKGVFTPSEPGIYTITYQIEMIAGKSEQSFIGKDEYTIEVIDSTEIIEVGIKNISIDEVRNSEGIITSYRAIGTIYIMWSDNTCLDYSTIFVSFKPDEISKDVNITLDLNGERYIYTVNVKR